MEFVLFDRAKNKTASSKCFKYDKELSGAKEK